MKAKQFSTCFFFLLFDHEEYLITNAFKTNVFIQNIPFHLSYYQSNFISLKHLSTLLLTSSMVLSKVVCLRCWLLQTTVAKFIFWNMKDKKRRLFFIFSCFTFTPFSNKWYRLLDSDIMFECWYVEYLTRYPLVCC